MSRKIGNMRSATRPFLSRATLFFYGPYSLLHLKSIIVMQLLLIRGNMKKIIDTENAPAAIGPYSQAVQAGSLVFVSGQIPINPKTGELVSGGIATQTRQALLNVKAIVEAAHSSIDHILKCTVLLSDMQDFAEMNRIPGVLPVQASRTGNIQRQGPPQKRSC